MSLTAAYLRFELGTALTAAQAAFFAAHGFLHFRGFLGPAAVADLRAAGRALEQEWLRAGVRQVHGVPFKRGYDLDGAPLLQRLAFTSLYSPAFAQLARDPRLRALLPLLDGLGRIGEDEHDGVVLNHYVNGPRSGYTRLGWHTDALRYVFSGRRPRPMLNVGVHLDDCPAANGGLRLLPGTHRQGLWALLFRKAYIRDHAPDPAEVAIETRAGDLTVHDGRLWHRVAQAQVTGEASRRRVVYIPLVTGDYRPRGPEARPLLYQRFLHLIR